jgi:hypothetical protein
METNAHFRALLNISFGVASKTALLPVHPYTVPLECISLMIATPVNWWQVIANKAKHMGSAKNDDLPS